MSGNMRKQWSDLKGKLSKEAQAALAKAKADLGPTLDKYESAAQTLDKELAGSKGGGASKKASAAMDELKALQPKVIEACEGYTKILDGFKTSPGFKEATAKLRQIKYFMQDDVKEKAQEYALAAQRVTVFTFALILGKDWVDTIDKFTWHENATVKAFCTNSVMAIGADSQQLTPSLKQIQTKAEECRKTFTKALSALSTVARKEYASRKEVIAIAHKAFEPLGNAMQPASDGVMGWIRTWAAEQQSLTPKGDRTWADSKEGKAAVQLQQAAERVLHDNEVFLNKMEAVLDKLPRS